MPNREAAPSPRPWRFEQSGKSGTIWIVDANGNDVASISPLRLEAVASVVAAEIVAAVNATDPEALAWLKAALVECALPYEALLLDQESRKWIAPTVWKAIETAVAASRAALAGTP